MEHNSRPTMSVELQEFLSAFAMAIGVPDGLRRALEVSSTGLMSSPKELLGVLANLHKSGKIPNMAKATEALAKYLPTEEEPVPVEPPIALEPTVQVTTAEPAAPAVAAEPKIRITKVAKTPAAAVATGPVADIGDVRPASVDIDGVPVEATDWRSLMVVLAERAIDDGKDVPQSFLRPGPNLTRPQETQLKGGQWLYTNLSKGDRVKRVNALAALLDSPVVLTTKGGDQIPLGSAAS